VQRDEAAREALAPSMGCPAGSKACASTPRARKAASTPWPDISDTSRSAERPPIRTATFPN